MSHNKYNAFESRRSRGLHRFTLAAAALFGFAGVASAATINVPSAQAPTIAVAINIASSGDEIVVAPGTYFESVSLGGKTLVLRSSSGPESTIIDGLGQFQSVIRMISGEGPATVIEGFTIRNGQATAPAPGDRGGAIYCNLTSPTIRDCILVDNRAINGGAFYANGGTPKLEECLFIGTDALTNGSGGAVYGNNTVLSATDCVFIDNAALNQGGAIRAIGTTSLTLVRCEFRENTASAGGAIDLNVNVTASTFRDCRFFDNASPGAGGAIQVLSATGINQQFVNCVFDGNTTGTNGGALFVTGRVELVNCTMTQNGANGNGGALSTIGAGIAVVRNSIIWANVPTGLSGPNHTVTFTCHQSSIAGAGNIVQNPQFANLSRGDLRLAEASPCIDAGNTTLLAMNVAGDINGLPRAVNVRDVPTGIGAFGYMIDMGAFEFPAAATPSSCPGDLNFDGLVNGADLGLLLGGWGSCP